MSQTIQIKCSAADRLPLDQILEFQGGLKKLSKKSLEKLKRRILEDGFIAPIFVWDDKGDYRAIDGHQRLAALISLREDGIDIPLLPVAFIEAADEAEARRRVLSVSSQYGEFDMEELQGWLDDIDADIAETLRLVDTAIELDIPGSAPEETVGDDDLKTTDIPEVTQYGDIWELGHHRLMCGDATKEEMVSALMNGISADLFLTDPPYNVEYVGKTKDALTIKNDKQEDSQFRKFLIDAFSSAFKNIKSGAAYYIWHSDSEGYNFRGALYDIGIKVRQCLIWNKNTLVMGRQDYQWKHEPCLYGWNSGGSHAWYSNRKQTTIIDMDRPTRSEEHPTMKPVALYEYQINNSSKEGDIVLDTFAGSGTAILSAEKTGRMAYCMELSPHYCDVIVNRYKAWCLENDRPCEIKLNGQPYRFGE